MKSKVDLSRGDLGIRLVKGDESVIVDKGSEAEKVFKSRGYIEESSAQEVDESPIPEGKPLETEPEETEPEDAPEEESYPAPIEEGPPVEDGEIPEE